MNKHLRLFVWMAGLFLSVYTLAAQAAFFQLAENSPAGLGNAFAGGSAIAEDASTVWYNPAGMTRLNGSQFVVGGHFIAPSTQFSKTSANLSPLLGGGAISGGDGGDAGESALAPNFYYTRQLDDRKFLGIGINAPFGLATDYEDGWVGRYHANRSEIKTVNLNVGLGYKVSDQFSVGGGINYQKIEAELTQAVDYGSICALASVGACAAPGANDGSAVVKADDNAWGFNLGLMWNASDSTRAGLAYRSKIKYNVTGTSDVTAPSPTAAAVGASPPFNIVDANIRADITLPATLSASVYHQMNPQWAVMGDITRTEWSKLPELRIHFDSSQSDSVVTLNLRDVNRYSVGANYNPSGAWIYRFGVALDKTPTPNAESRTPRLPDQDRLWLAVGAGYKKSDSLSYDFSYTHIKVDNADINKTAGSSPTGENFLRGSIVGSYKADINILSAQARWAFK